MKRLWGTPLLLAFVLTSAVGSLASANVNLLANPGFEDAGGSYDGWFTFGAGVQTDTGIVRSGTTSSKVFGEFTGCPDAPTFDVGGYGQLFTPTPGMLYEFTGYSYVDSNDPIPGTDTCSGNRMLAKIVFFDAPVGGFEIQSNEIVIGAHDSVTDQWNPFTVSSPAPTGAMRVEALILFLQPGCDTGSVFVDDLSLCESTEIPEPNILVNPSFDTDLSGWTSFGNVFHEGASFARRTAPGSAKLFSTFVAETPSGLFQSFAASEGNVWRLDAYSMTTCFAGDPITGTNENYVVARIVYRDGVGDEIESFETTILDGSSPLGTWTTHSVLGAAPAGTVAAEAFILFISPALEAGAAFVDDIGFQLLSTVDVPGITGPTAFRLHQNSPNPFNPTTRISFDLLEADAVTVSVYDVAGRQVVTLLEGPLDSGSHEVVWNGTAANGVSVATGIYRYVLETSTGRSSRSMVLSK